MLQDLHVHKHREHINEWEMHKGFYPNEHELASHLKDSTSDCVQLRKNKEAVKWDTLQD